MDQENQQPRPRVSKSFIFSLILVAAIIGLLAYFIFFSGTNAKSISYTDFVNHLYNGKVNDIQLVQAETVIKANGHYTDVDSKGKTVKITFTTDIPVQMYDSDNVWYVDINKDGTVGPEEKINTSITQMIIDAQNKMKKNENPDFVVSFD